MVAAAPIQPYSRFINMFRLGVSPGVMYRIPWENAEDKPVKIVLEDGDRFYSLEPPENESKPDYWMMRRIIEQGFREKLTEANCSFKGPQSYIAYWSKPYHPRL
jgi:hypothetical protein